MRIALIAPPFIPVPPKAYGGTELFVAHLAEALTDRGHEVIVYANGESRLRCEVRSLYPEAKWPLVDPTGGVLRNLHHNAWALHDAAYEGVDLIHLNDTVAVPLSRFTTTAMVHTLHHPHEPELSRIYEAHPDLTYVAISRAQAARERLPRLEVVHHGIRVEDYTYVERKQPYLSFLGRIAPPKGVHLAIEVAKRSGIPLKIAGEIQPTFLDYWENQVKPHVDGRHIEYIGEATLPIKNELLGHSMAMLFPIQWNEPFGLVMIEAMACGTPVLALPGGSVSEIVRDGVSGWVCRDVAELAERAAAPSIEPAACREYVTRCFSVQRMAEAYEQVYLGAVGEIDAITPDGDADVEASPDVLMA